MKKKEVLSVSTDSDTRKKILDTATTLFALSGFKAVTLKEIAQAVDIKIASIYYYYENKDALIEDVLARFDEVYREYHDWLSVENEKADSLQAVIDNLFNEDLVTKLNPVVRLGMSMALKEQHSHDIAYKSALTQIYEGSIENIKAGFDRLIERNIIPPSDTKTLATLFVFCMTAGNEILLHAFTDTELPVDSAKAYSGLKILMTAALSQGLLPVSDEA